MNKASRRAVLGQQVGILEMLRVEADMKGNGRQTSREERKGRRPVMPAGDC